MAHIAYTNRAVDLFLSTLSQHHEFGESASIARLNISKLELLEALYVRGSVIQLMFYLFSLDSPSILSHKLYTAIGKSNGGVAYPIQPLIHSLLIDLNIILMLINVDNSTYT